MPSASIYLARHGETEWALAGKHTGRSDIALTPRGEREAVLLGERLRGTAFTHVLSSPLQRARRTAELAGFASVVQIEPDLLEWHYGEFEGLRSAEIHGLQPGWHLFRDGCRGGESVPAIAARADRLLEHLRRLQGLILLFAHGHILRVLAARFLGLDASVGANLFLGTAAVSVLGYEHPPADPVVQLWNDRRHLDQ
jgi:probable phosphoglycerate mutase